MAGSDRSTHVTGSQVGVLAPGDNARIRVDNIFIGGSGSERSIDAPPPVDERAREVFVGRTAEMEQLAKTLLSASPGAVAITAAIEGMAGVGKSYLADHFALLNENRFGAYLVLPIDPLSPQGADELMAVLADRLKVAASVDAVRKALGATRTLVHVENVDSREAAAAAGRLVAWFPGLPLILTGRMEGLGRGFGRVVRLQPFDPAEGARQIAAELAFMEAEPIGEADACRLAEALSGLPLALHLAAGYLVAGSTPEEFLQNLERECLGLEPENPLETGVCWDEKRLIIASAFDLSLDLLTRRLPDHAPAFPALSLLPPAGFGTKLAAATAGMEEGAAGRLLEQARKLSLLEKIRSGKSAPARWQIHPLLASHLRNRMDTPEREDAEERISDWFLSRLPEPEGEDYTPWQELNGEHPALGHWLRRVPKEMGRAVVANTLYGNINGPWPDWAEFCETLLKSEPPEAAKSNALWLLANCRMSMGQHEEGLEAAEKKGVFENERGAEREFALARSLVTDIYQSRGDLDEVLRIRQEEELPVYERLGDVRSRALTMGQIADIYQSRGDLDEALRIRQEEELPVYERLGDVRERAVTMGRIADIYQSRGDLDEAFRIRQEESLPVYERLGDVRSRAVTMGQIADIYRSRGDLDEALRIRQEEELPVYERLGDVRSRAVTMGKIADIYRSRGDLDEALRIHQEEELPVYERLRDLRNLVVGRANIALLYLKLNPPRREEANHLLCQSLTDARRMKIPEADHIRTILQNNKMTCEDDGISG